MSFLLTFSRYRIICLIAVLAPLFFLSSGISTLKITADNRVFYGKDNPYFRDFLKFEETFTSNDNVIFVIDGRAATTKQLLAAVEWVTQRSYTLSSAIRVDSLTNYPIPKSSDDTFFVSTVAEEACRVDVSCTAGLSGLARDLNLTNRLISGDLKSAGIIATLNIERTTRPYRKISRRDSRPKSSVSSPLS